MNNKRGRYKALKMNDLVKEKLAELRIWLVSAITAFFGIIGYIWTRPNDNTITYNSSYFALVAVAFLIILVKLLINKEYKGLECKK